MRLPNFSPVFHLALALLALLALLWLPFCAAAHEAPKPPLPSPVQPAPLPPFQDNWGGWRLHMGVSAAIGAVGILAFPDEPAAVFAGCMVPGLVRELRQEREPGNGFSRRDMVANAAGCLAGELAGGVVGAMVDANGQRWVTWSRRW